MNPASRSSTSPGGRARYLRPVPSRKIIEPVLDCGGVGLPTSVNSSRSRMGEYVIIDDGCWLTQKMREGAGQRV